MLAKAFFGWTQVAPILSCTVSVTLLPATLRGVTAPAVRPLSLRVTVGVSGAVVTVKPAALSALPPGVLTLIGPPRVLAGTVSVICATESTVKLDAAWPSSTSMAVLRPLPVRVTVVATGPEVGVKPVTTGGGVTVITVRLDALMPLPAEVVMVIAERRDRKRTPLRRQ
jgi:hypothetical protein